MVATSSSEERLIPAPCDPQELRQFLDSFLYREEAFLESEITGIDPDARRIDARLDTEMPLPIAQYQRSTRATRHTYRRPTC